MDITPFIFFTLLAFFCLILSKLFTRTGLGAGIGVVGMLIFLLLGLMIGGEDETVTSLQIIGGVATDVPLDLGISTDYLSVIFLSLAITTLFAGVLS